MDLNFSIWHRETNQQFVLPGCQAREQVLTGLGDLHIVGRYFLTGSHLAQLLSVVRVTWLCFDSEVLSPESTNNCHGFLSCGHPNNPSSLEPCRQPGH